MDAHPYSGVNSTPILVNSSRNCNFAFHLSGIPSTPSLAPNSPPATAPFVSVSFPILTTSTKTSSKGLLSNTAAIANVNVSSTYPLHAPFISLKSGPFLATCARDTFLPSLTACETRPSFLFSSFSANAPPSSTALSGLSPRINAVTTLLYTAHETVHRSSLCVIMLIRMLSLTNLSGSL